MKRFFAFICVIVLLFASFPSMAVAADTMDVNIKSAGDDIVELEMAYPELFPDLCPDDSKPQAFRAPMENEMSDVFMDYLVEKFADCETDFDIKQFNIPFSRWEELRSVIWYEMPELFHIYGLGCSYNSDTGAIVAIGVDYRSYADTSAEYQDCLDKMLDGAEYLLQGIKDNNDLTDVEKALLLHDRLAVWTEYDLGNMYTSDGSHKIFTAYSALGEGLSVCQGYAMAYMYLLDQVGIDSDYCSSSELYHGWNIVYIDGVAYHVDVTWDDPVNGASATYYDDYGRVFHDNFLLSSDGIWNSGHEANDYNTAPNDSRYDRKNTTTWWMDSNTAIQLIDNNLYYLDKNYGKVICADDGSTVYTPTDYAFSRKLSGVEGKLLYSTPVEVRAIDPKTGVSFVVYTSKNDDIIGMKFEKGKIWVQLEDDNGNSRRESVEYVAPEITDYTYTVENDEAVITGYIGAGGDITIPDTLDGCPVTAIGKNAFQACEKLETVVIPDSVETLGTYAFWDCPNLRSVTIGKGVTSFGERAFGNCKILNRVIISEGVTSIGTAAFEFCTGLEVISIPEGVTEIGERAFRLTDLKKISLPETLKTIGLSAFESCNELAAVYYAGAQEQWNEISVGESNAYLLSATMEFGKTPETPLVPEYTYKVENGEATIIKYNGPGGEIAIPMVFGGYRVTGIGQEAFADCDNLTAVTIGYSITTIGKKAFYDCDSLTSLWISDTVTTIGEAAFSGCDKLETITVPHSVQTMEGYVFASCTGLKTVDISNSITEIGEHLFDGCTGLTSVMIPDGVTAIGDGAFYQCAGLTTVTIPGSVTAIGASAFAGCDALTNVFYKGTSEQWQEVTVGSGNEKLQNAEIRYTMDPADPGDADFTYRLENGEATITGYTGAGGDITIPSALGGCPVTTIDYYAFERNNDLTSVVIPGTVKTIGFGAFRYCPNLTSVTLGDGIVDMGVQTFMGCTGLKSFVIPDSVTEISAEVFYECTGLEEVTIGSGVTAIGDSAFRFCDSLKTVELPAALQSIGHLAFYSCDNLSAYYVHEDNAFFASEQGVLFNKDKTVLLQAPTTISGKYVLPETVTVIGDKAFQYCRNLTEIQIGPNVNTIGEYAFSGCSGLTSLTIPDSVTQLGDHAFYDCSELESITIGTGITELPEGAFYRCTGLRTLTIPDHITVIGNSAFNSCHNLTVLTLPAGVTLIGEGAFDYCNNLTDVYYKGTRHQWNFLTIQEKNDILFSAYVHCADEQETPDAKDFIYEIKNGEATIIGYKGAGGNIEISPIWAGYPVTAIAKEAFYWNSLITGVTIPGSVKRIDDDAFFNCVNMVTLTLEEGVQEIGSSAFFACDKLTSVIVPDSVTKIESDAFCLCGNVQSVTLGKGVQTIESGAFAQCEKLVSIQVDPDNAFFRDVNGVLFKGTTLVQYPSGLAGSYTVPAGTTVIGGSAFCWTDHLTEVTLPDSVKTIGSYAFWYSGIKKIQLGKNLETIGYGAFELSSLTEIDIPDSVTTIEGTAFKECYALKTVKIGLGVKTIGYEAFCWCYPETVYYAGMRAQWDSIEIAGYNDDLLNANIVYEGDHTHSYVAKVTKPTCTAKGYTTYTCSCGDTYKDNYVDVISHSYAAATCTKPKTCKVCGATSGKALGHSYKSGSCTRCKYKPAGAKITTQPVNVAVASGKTAKVSIKATGTGLKYTWYYAKKGAKSYTKATSTTNSYSLKMSSSYDGTKVYCMVTDSYGNSVKSSTVTLYKGTPAKITTQPKGVTVANGKTGKLEIKASGSSLKYTWYVKYKGASSYTKVGSSSKTYSFKMAAKLSGAQAYCVVKDKYGITVKSSVVTIKLAPQPKITTQPKSVTQVSGKTVKFSIKASGEGLKYQWYYAKKGSSSFKKLSGKTSATYSVKVSSSVNGRKYYCLVTDKYGQTVKSSAVTLTMKTVAKITTQPKNVTVKNGKTAKVTIKAVGDGLKYTWYYLKPGDTKYTKSSITKNVFSVKMVAAWKNTKVYCVIADKYGNSVKSSVVTLKMK